MSSCNSCSAPSPSAMCAARMAYAQLTDFGGKCSEQSLLTGAVLGAGKVNSSYDIRMNLQRNAEAFMEQERQKAMARLAPCAPCKRPLTDQGTQLADQWVVKCDAVSCTRTLNNPNGLGDGRNYA